ncbi:ty3-gypsy retrotransposon protein [Tanacetum coccineum]|uniref:Ty3-gypsy retrotransposon protein n=1 Tax=Tanacetum coccineum TaxID=301880 RepID=A0ABQ5ICY9_9ASTR
MPTPLSIKWISAAERQERMNLGLCFNCDNKCAKGHKCPGKFMLMMSSEEEHLDTGPSGATAEPADSLETGDVSCLNSLVGHGSPRSLQLWGTISSTEVTLTLQGFTITVDLFVLPLQGAEVTMEFAVNNKKHMLKGDDALRFKKIGFHQMQALWDTDKIYGVYEIHKLQPDQAKDDDTTSMTATPIHPKIDALMDRYQELFAKPTSLPPHRVIDHRIHLFLDTKPVNVRPYRYPHYQKAEMEKLVKEMLDQGIIRFSHNPFSSPVLLVKKKDGNYRFCVNYRALNVVTVKDKFPIPTADEMFDELGGAIVFTKLDLRAGYHQIRECQFYVKRSKCVFGAASLEYLGHIISGKGVEMDPKKVEVVTTWPVPKTQKQGEREHKAFADLKHQLFVAPVLSLPDFEEVFVVETDASGDGIGAVLLQKGRSICFFSRKLGARMKLAATYQKELYAIVEAVYKWRQYLIGRRFLIHTNHKNIKELMQQVIQTPVQQQYVRKLMGFNFDIEYKPGATNIVADDLSRMHSEDDLEVAAFMSLSRPISGLLESLKEEHRTLKEVSVLIQRQQQGEVIKGFRVQDGLLIFQDRYYVGLESKLKLPLLREFHETRSAGHYKVFPGGLLQPLPIPEAVWEEVSMDFITWLPMSKGLTVIFVVVDRLTKYAHFSALPTSYNAHRVAELFMDIVVKHHGFPKAVVSDRDAIFVSQFWSSLFKLSGTQLKYSTAYHRQTDGQTEVVNRGLEQYLQAMVSGQPQQWS